MTRRTILISVLAAAAFVPSTASASDWPYWRGPDRTGISSETGWRSAGAEAPLWSRELGRGYSAPSIANGRLYTRGFDEETELDVTYCLDVETGKEIWTHTAPSKLWDNMHGGGTLTTPAVDGDTVYVLSRMGPLYAFAAENGAVRWERKVDEEFGVELGYFGLCTSPVVLGDLLIVNVGKTVALDKKTGETRWETKDYGVSYGTPAPFELDGRELLAVFNGAGLTVLEARTGKEVAVFDWTGGYNVNCATPIVMGERVFISTGFDEKGCALLELGEDGLKAVWTGKQMMNKMTGCVLVDGYLYGFDDAMLKCIDLEGEEHWRVRGLGKGTVISSDGRLIVLSEEGELQIGPASPEGFEPTYTSKVLAEGPCWTMPVLANGRIYCRNSAGTLVSLDHRPAAKAAR